MAERVVRGACPHDCPDTCAMLVTVDEEGRATHVAGDPEHPITAGFLCGKVSNYLDRVYADDRLLHPLIRTGEKGAGEFRPASWDEALDAVAEGLRGAIDGHGGESLLPYSYMGTQGFVQGELMGTRLMNALGGSKLERTICASAGIAGVLATQGVSPEVDPELWHRARYVIVWAWNPMSTAPHLWRKLLDARSAGAKLVVIDPYRSRTARVADVHLRPNPGTDGALALGNDAGGRRRGARGRRVVPRTRDGLRRATRAAGRAHRRANGSSPAASTPVRCARSPSSLPARSPRCSASAWGASVTRAPRSHTGRSPACRR